jgi:hypothetical protein
MNFLFLSATVKFGAAGFSETLLIMNQNVWPQIPEDSNVTVHHCDSLKSGSDFLLGIGKGKGHSVTYLWRHGGE